jgi:hypothetical protein
MRKKHGSPARSKGWRHSLEVTTPSRYLRDTSNLKIKPLDCSPVVSDSNTDEPYVTVTKREKSLDPDFALNVEEENVEDPDAKDPLPFAMIALEEVWKYVKSNCAELVLNERSPAGGIDPKKHSQLVKEVNEKKSNSFGGFKLRSERSSLQVSGRTFFIGKLPDLV